MLSWGTAFMLAMFTRLTFGKTKNKVFHVTFLVQWYSIHWNTEEPVTQISSLASSSQPGVVSQLAEAYTRRDRNCANNAWLARTVQRCILRKVRRNELLIVLQSVSRAKMANTVDINAQTLIMRQRLRWT
jgi:hypothetical protein